MNEREVGVLPPARRTELLANAAREFAAAGYERASLNRIIRACGMSKSSFYHYVPSKQALFELVVEDLVGELVATLDAPTPQDLADAGFWAGIERLLDRLLQLSRDEPRFTDLGRMFYLPGAPVDGGSALATAIVAFESWLSQVLAVGREVGAVRDDLPASLQGELTIAVLRTFDDWTLREHSRLDPHAVTSLVEAQADTLRRLLAPAP